MATPRKSVNRQVGSSFTIKNLLNLPDDGSKSNGGGSQVQCSSIVPLLSLHVPNAASPENPRPYAPCPYGDQMTQIPSYGMGAGFPRQTAPLGGINAYTAKLCRRRPTRKTTKHRPLFSPHQVQTMEKEFDSMKYLTEGKRAELAAELMLTETQVKTWFQNRRTRWRKELRNEDPPRKVPDGRWKHSILARHYAI